MKGRLQIGNETSMWIDFGDHRPETIVRKQPPSATPYNLMTDKFHEECGVAAIYGHPEASKLAYLSLYALQHRGQESAGISTSDGELIHTKKSMGHVAEIFTNPVLQELPGSLAIGHTRYSTTGDTVERNAQPFSVACNKGRIAVAHNGNITNAAELRKDLEARGAIFRRRATLR